MSDHRSTGKSKHDFILEASQLTKALSGILPVEGTDHGEVMIELGNYFDQLSAREAIEDSKKWHSWEGRLQLNLIDL